MQLTGPGMTPEVEERINALERVALTILPGSYKVDDLPAASASTVGVYARVSDLFGEKTDLVLGSMAGTTYFWQPVRPFYSRNVALNTGNVTLTTLKSPTVIIGTGTLAQDRNVILSDQFAYPGAQFEIGFAGTITLGTLAIKAPGGATLATLLAGGNRRFFFTDGRWQNI